MCAWLTQQKIATIKLSNRANGVDNESAQGLTNQLLLPSQSQQYNHDHHHAYRTPNGKCPAVVTQCPGKDGRCHEAAGATASYAHTSWPKQLCSSLYACISSRWYHQQLDWSWREQSPHWQVSCSNQFTCCARREKGQPRKKCFRQWFHTWTGQDRGLLWQGRIKTINDTQTDTIINTPKATSRCVTTNNSTLDDD